MSDNKKERILFFLNKLLNIYQKDPSKKFQTKALFNAIISIENYNGLIIDGKQLQKELKGIGKGLSDRIDEILITGSLQECLVISEKNDICDLFKSITGVGDKRAEEWYDLGYRSLNDIKDAIQNKKISSTHHIDLGIKYYEDLKERIPRNEIDKMKKIIEKTLKKIDKDLIFEICGSYRRGQESSGDMDIIISNPKFVNNINQQNYLKIVVEKLTNDGFIIDHLTEKGDKKYMGFCKLQQSGTSKRQDIKNKARRIDIRVFDYENYWCGILYFTGNKEFNIKIRNKALELGYSLNEYGLTKKDTNEKIFLENENQIFELLKLPYSSPFERNIK